MQANDVFGDALRLEENGQWREAAAGYRALIRNKAPATRCQALIGLARCLLETCKQGETDEADELLCEAEKLLVELGEPELRGQLLLQQGRLDELQGELKRALARYSEARSVLETAGAGLVEADLVLASAERRRGELNHALSRLQAIDEASLPPRLLAEFLDEMGAVLLARGETRAAIEILERALDLDEADASDYAGGRSRLLLADACMRGGMRPRAKELIDEAVNIYQQNRAEAGLSEAYALTGLWYEESEDYVSAAQFYQESYELDRQSDDRLGQARAKRRQGRTYRKRGQTARARELFEEARRLQPRGDDVEAAALYREEGQLALSGSEPDYEKAIVLFQRALSIAEEDGDARVTAIAKRNLARALREDDQLAEAEKLLLDAKEALQERGDLRELDDLLDDLGEVLLEQCRFDEAEAFLLESLELDRQLGRIASKGRTLLLLGRVAIEKGERGKAGGFFREALHVYRSANLEVGLSDALQQVGMWHLSQGKLEEAIECFHDGLEIDNRLNDPLGRVRAKRSLAAAFRLRGNIDRADDYLREAQRDMGSIDDPVERAQLELEAGRLALARGANREARERVGIARDVFEKVGRRDDEASCCRVLALAVAYEGRYGEAINLLERAREVFEEARDVPELDELYDDLATVYLMSRQLDRAEENVVRSLEVGSRMGWVQGKGRSLLLLGKIALERGNLESARGHIVAAREAYAAVHDEVGESEACVQLGDWYVKNLDYVRAVLEFKQARRLEQQHRDRRGVARCNRKLANVYLERNEFERAEEALEEAETSLAGIDDPRERAPLELELGRLWSKKEEHRRAVHHFRAALEGFNQLSQDDERRVTYQLLITSYQAQGELAEALECIREMGIERAAMYGVLVRDLHPRVAEAAQESFVSGRYQDAVMRAFKALEEELMQRAARLSDPPSPRAGVHDVLDRLVQTATADMPLADTQTRNRFRDFTLGGFELLRNAVVHRNPDLSPADTFAAISVAHLISAILDGHPLAIGYDAA